MKTKTRSVAFGGVITALALALMLLAGVLVLYWLYDRLIGIDKLKLG